MDQDKGKINVILIPEALSLCFKLRFKSFQGKTADTEES